MLNSKDFKIKYSFIVVIKYKEEFKKRVVRDVKEFFEEVVFEEGGDVVEVFVEEEDDFFLFWDKLVIKKFILLIL